MRRNVLGIVVVALLIGVAWLLVCKRETLPVGIVVPHHDMVASVRQAYLENVSQKIQPKTIVVFVPDHFAQSKNHIITSEQSWETILGTIEGDKETIQQLGLPLDSESFQSEHGLTILLKEIKQYFGTAKIVPVMFSRNATYVEVNDFVDTLYETCSTCFVMASVDFSHTNTANGAALHDELVLRELTRANPVELYKYAEVDSPESLVALTLWSKKHGAEQFNLFSHTNSGYLANRATGEMTSHIIGGFHHGEKKVLNNDAVTLMLAGDTMFARSVHDEFMQSSSSPLARLGERFFWGVDVALVNLEGVFTESESFKKNWEKIPPELRFSKEYAEVPDASRISAVGLANNHTFDGGELDLRFTTELLTARGIKTIGYPRENPTVILKEQGDTKVALVAIATHEETDDIARQVTQYSDEGYRVIAYIHWGEEYSRSHTKQQEEMAKHLVSAGADLIVGSHSHVVQDVAVYDGVPIVYSLGNFLFDQDFKLETQVGAVLGVKMTSEEIELFLIPVKNFNQVEVLKEGEYLSNLKTWTEGWAAHEVEFGRFLFPVGQSAAK